MEPPGTRLRGLPGPTSLRAVVDECAGPVFIDGSTGRSLDGGALAAYIRRWDAWLAADPDRVRTPIGLQLSDPLTMIGNFVGAVAAGAMIVPLDPAAPDADLAARMHATGVRGLVNDKGVGAHHEPLDVEPIGAPRSFRRPDLPGHASLLMASSGTTGTPKIMPLTESRLMATATAVAQHHELSVVDRGYCPLPLFHINGLVVGVLATLVSGSTLIVDRRFSARRMWPVVEQQGATWLNLVPAILAILTEHPAPSPELTGRIRFARSASAPLPDAVRRRFEAHTGITVLETYGMTEAASQICANPLDPALRRPGSVGLPVGLDLRIVDDSGSDLPTGSSGNVEIRGTAVVDRYWSHKRGRLRARAAVDTDGWLRTGDLGHVDSDGFLFLESRAGEIINRGGEKVVPREIEDLLASEPGVRTAVVVPREHPVLGHEPVAYVRPGQGIDSDHLRARLVELCRSGLSPFKHPAEIVVTADLPAGPTGKVRRAELRNADRERAARSSAAAGRHLYPVDVVRLVTVLGVISVHALAVGIGGNNSPAGIAQTLLHMTREVFLFLSAFVLAHSMKGRPRAAVPFWRRRFPLVIAPYAAWSAIYLVANGGNAGVGATSARYARDLLDAGARYHLYFLLLTFQLYVIFPSLYRWITSDRRRERTALLATLAFQFAFTAAVHYRLPTPPPVRAWLAHPGSWLPSYPLYVVAGVVAAGHLREIEAWVRDHARLVGLIVMAGLAVGLTGYLVDTRGLGMDPVHASEVFSPQVTIVSIAAVIGQYALGLWLSDRIGPRTRRRLETSSDLSFGVYLAHPLVLQGVLALGFGTVLSRLGPGPGVALVLVVLVPSVYLMAAAVARVARLTPLSLTLTGRRRPAPAPVEAVGQPVLEVLEVVSDALPVPTPAGAGG